MRIGDMGRRPWLSPLDRNCSACAAIAALGAPPLAWNTPPTQLLFWAAAVPWPPNAIHFLRCPVSKVTKLKTRRPAPALGPPTDLDEAAVAAVSEALNGLLADAFALY